MYKEVSQCKEISRYKEVSQCKEISLSDMEAVMAETLENGGSVKFTPTGNSMFPMLRHRQDTVLIESLTRAPEKYEIFLYKRPNGAFVLHRLVKKTENGLVFRGDNQYKDETGVRPEALLGVVTGFTRNGRFYGTEHPGYRLYERLWVNSVSIRHFCRRGKGWIFRHIRQIRGNGR